MASLCVFMLLLAGCAAPGARGLEPAHKHERLKTVAPHNTEVSDQTAPTGQARERALLATLRTTVSQGQENEDLRAFFAFHDLNGDGAQEAVVHLTGPGVCGTGGCTTLVFQWDPSAAGYTKTHHIPTTRPPIHASRHEGCPWSMLWVQRSGGGRRAELHVPHPLSDVDSCNGPIGSWNEAQSELLIPVYDSRTEGVAL